MSTKEYLEKLWNAPLRGSSGAKAASRAKRDELAAAITRDDLIRLATRRGYKNPTRWAYTILSARKKT